MEVRSIVFKIGRPNGSINAPGWLKIKNPNWKIISVDGPQYKKLLENGYKPSYDGIIRLIADDYEYTAPRKRCRPPGSKNKTQKVKLFKKSVGIPPGSKNKIQEIQFTNEKVQNPTTKRLIITDGVTF